MESGSPPLKKLKQARLPFQILSPKERETAPSSGGVSRKRLLSDCAEETASTVKIFKSSAEDAKENKSTEITVKLNAINDVKNKSLPSPEEVIPEIIPICMAKEACDDGPNTKGRHDCICIDVDSAEEALESELSSVELQRHNCSSASTITVKEDVTKLSNDFKSDRLKNVTTEKSPEEQESETLDPPQLSNGNHHSDHLEKSDNSKSSSQPKEVIVDLPSSSAQPLNPKKEEGSRESVGPLTKKTYDLFAKWRKAHVDSDENKSKDVRCEDIRVEKAEEVVECIAKKECPATSSCSEGAHIQSSESKHEECLEEDEIETPETTDTVENQNKTAENESKNILEPSQSADEDVISILDNVPCAIKCQSNPNFTSNTPVTPKSVAKSPLRKLTPKQMERQKSAMKKLEEREKQKFERQMEKKRLKDEKHEQRKKEREEKDEQKRREKDEKEKKRQAELDLKLGEKKRKEDQKAEEKRRKDVERRKADEEEERKKAKASAMFTSFFVAKGAKAEKEMIPLPVPTVQNFMPFEVKADMRMAPILRVCFLTSQKQSLDGALDYDTCNLSEQDLYLKSLLASKIVPKSSPKTWPYKDTKDDDDDDDIFVIEQQESGIFLAPKKKVQTMRVKFLQFHENHRPAYRGTWRKQRTCVNGRRPFSQEKILDYEVDSADEWEEEEPGESLHGSDDDKEKESEDEYEVDNSVFVPHGYLSEDEGDDDEANNEVLSPETQKAKLKLLGEEFEAQMKNDTAALKPIIIFLASNMPLNSNKLGLTRYQKLFDRRAVWLEEEGPIVLARPRQEDETCDISAIGLSDTTQTGGLGLKRKTKKKIISEDAIPALITLVHGNRNNGQFLSKEFSAFLQLCSGKDVESQSHQESTGSAQKVVSLEAENQPRTPSKSAPNPLVGKWSPLPPASRVSILDKIKELAVRKQCPEEGPMYNRSCWYVPKEIRDQYGLADLKLPSTEWQYTLKPKIPNTSGSPSNLAISSAVEQRTSLITKFTKVMTPEEKEKQWESTKSKTSSSKSSSGKITAFTCQTKLPVDPKSSGSSEPSQPQKLLPAQPQAKKRVSLLVSVPRGQQIGSNAHCSLLSKFEASASKSVTSSNSNAQSEKPEVECIELD